MTDLWHGVYGSYPIPDKFRALVLQKAPVPSNRYQALREVGDFYHWLHSQECREAAKIVGMNKRRQAQQNRAGRMPATPRESET